MVFSFQKISLAQDTLPKISVTQLGTKVLVSWNNPFTNVANINVQRSSDSLKNFTTIGSLLDVSPGINGFADPKEFIPSDQYYRLFISFHGGSYIFTKSHRPGKDTLSQVPPIEKPPAVEKPRNDRNHFIPSPHVFMGRDNNVIISLPDAAHKRYSIRFYRDDGSFLFEISKIKENYLTLDKANFLRAGLFIFELYDNKIIIERHNFYIPRDGQPMPAMDTQGNLIRMK
ncbi:MAG: hypothetical protein ABI366_10545 [Ginsengibacter sp.]